MGKVALLIKEWALCNYNSRHICKGCSYASDDFAIWIYYLASFLLWLGSYTIKWNQTRPNTSSKLRQWEVAGDGVAGVRGNEASSFDYFPLSWGACSCHLPGREGRSLGWALVKCMVQYTLQKTLVATKYKAINGSFSRSVVCLFLGCSDFSFEATFLFRGLNGSVFATVFVVVILLPDTFFSYNHHALSDEFFIALVPHISFWCANFKKKMKQQKQPSKNKPLWQLKQQNALNSQIRYDQILPNHL